MIRGIIKILIILFLFAVVSLLISILFFSCGGSGKFTRYDFLQNFVDAQKRNFPEEASTLERFSPKHSYQRMDAYMTKAVNLFASYARSLSSRGSELIKDGAIRLRFIARDDRTDFYDVKFRYIDERNHLGLEMKIAFTSSFYLYEMKNGRKRIIHSFSPDLIINQYNKVYVLFVRDYLIVCNDDSYYALVKGHHLSSAGRIVAGELPAATSITEPYQIKYGVFEKEMLNQIAKSSESFIQPDMSFGPWNPLYPEDYVTYRGDKVPFIKRLKLGSTTRKAIITPVGASITYAVEIPTEPLLCFHASLASRYHYAGEGSEKVDFLVKIMTRGERTAFYRFRMPQFAVSGERWHEVKVDLKEFEGTKCLIELKTERSRLSKSQNDGKQVAIWGSPVLISKKATAGLRNVVLVSLDTLRADHLGCYGYERNTSSFIDKFAAGGVMFRNCISAATHTLPSHRSIFTGLYATGTGYSFHRHFENLYALSRIDNRIPTLAERLQSKGFTTVAFTGGGYVASNFGFDKGFDEYNEDISSTQDAAFDVQRAIEWLRRRGNERFFMFFHTYEIHAPYKRNHFLSEALKNDQWAQVIARYDSGIHYADLYLERLISELERQGILDQTLVIITSDHGERFDLTPEERKTHPNCGIHGRTVYDCESKVPLILGGWSGLEKGLVIQNQIRSVDIFPTILDLLNVEYRFDTINGNTLVPMFEELTKKIPLAFTEAFNPHSGQGAYLAGLRSGNDKLIKVDRFHKKNGKMTEKTSYEYYDLISDPAEKNNLVERAKSERIMYLKRVIGRILTAVKKRYNLYKYNIEVSSSHLKLKKQLRGLGYIN